MTLLPALLPPLALGLATWALGQPSTVIITSIALSGSLGIAVIITTLMSRRDEDLRARAEKNEYEGKLAAYRSELAGIDARCAGIVDRESRILARQYPGQARLDEIATTQDRLLWERRPGDDDFLAVRLGNGARPTSIVFKKSSASEGGSLADEVTKKHAVLSPGPITIRLTPGASKGVHGEQNRVDALLRSIAHQVAHQHSPSEVRLAVFSRSEAICGWAKWLPHCRLASTRESTPLVGREGEEASTALRAIAHEVSSRAGAPDGGPLYVVVADARDWDSLPGRLRRWLGPEHPCVCVVMAEERFEDLPGECDEVLDVSGTSGKVLRRAEPGSAPEFAPDGFDDVAAMKSALAVAPLTAGAEGTTSPIPRTARLADILGPDAASPESIAAAWDRSRRAFRLAAPIGVGPNDATVEINLRRDGPHGLIAGTTGSGKSELLQSLVASLSVRIPPDLLNFVLIDYKGGSAFREVEHLPQVVGVVTDLDERLAKRALESLKAEMRRREHLLASVSATDIIEYQSDRRDVPLANLVIIIDEFHRLVSEQPEFIEEMVRIAQQGRSLGVHLLLSTQKPSGVVTDQIRANTNLRICLRVTDEADSRDVLGSPEAAAVPRDLPGRTYIRVGTDPLRVCQAGRVSGLVPRVDASETVAEAQPFLEILHTPVVRRNGIAARLLRRPTVTGEKDDDEDDDLVDERKRLVESVRQAAVIARRPKQEPPWQPSLPMSVALVDIPATAGAEAGRGVIGILDEPEFQRQGPFELDLMDGHVCIAGSSNSGKTSALLTIAEAFASDSTPASLHIYGIDYGGGHLAPLSRLPQCGGVAAQHEWPRVQWVLQALKDTVAERLSGQAQRPFPQVLVLVDNFTGFWNAIQDVEGSQEQADDLVHLMDIGRAVGVTFAVAMERPDSMRANVLSMMSTRLALHMTDSEGYSAFGLPRIKQTSDPIAGRALVAGRIPHEMQLGLPSRLLSSEPWLDPDEGSGPLRIAPLPTIATYDEVHAIAGEAPEGAVLLGLREGTRPLFALRADQHLMVIGPRRSGRSNAMAVAATELARRGAERVFVINPRRSPSLQKAITLFPDGDVDYAESATDVASCLANLVQHTDDTFERYAAGQEPTGRWAVIIDDADVIEIPADATDALQKLVLRAADVGATIYLAADAQALRASYPSGVIRSLLNQRAGILLAPATSEDFDLLGARGKPTRVGPGRGWWCEGGGKIAVQVGLG